MKSILSDLAAMQSAADVLLSGLSDADWEKKSPENCWEVSIKDTMIHIAFLDKAARMLTTGEAESLSEITSKVKKDEMGRIATYESLTPKEVMEFWREERARLLTAMYDKSPKDRIPWTPGIVMSAKSLVSARQMELWAHTADICFALGIKPIVPSDEAILPTLFLSWQARPNQYRINNLKMPDVPMYLELTLPSGKIWSKGEKNPDNYVKGNALDWALVAVRRLHPIDTELEIKGDSAREWSMIVQTYAGVADPTPKPLKH